MYITKEQARNFMLHKQGLLGEYKFHDKSDILDFFKQVGCIQFDPIDICGRNADLVLFSRVENYDKSFLDELLYKDYLLVDQWDKVMSIYPISDWPSLKNIRLDNQKTYDKHLHEHRDKINHIYQMFEDNEYLNANDFDSTEEAKFFTWRHQKLSKAIIDYLFFKGDLIIHHRDGVKRYFALAKNHIDEHLLNQDDVFKSIEEFHKFQIKRRISSVGMLAAGPSDAYLGLGFKTAERRKYIAEMVDNNELVEVQIKDIKEPYYILKEDVDMISFEQDDHKRIEFIAPLDNFIWDRKLIKKIFDFEYRWEIYHQPHLRKFAPYALPILYGNKFIGQIEMSLDRKQNILIVKHIWYKHKKINQDIKKLMKKRIKDFAKFNSCKKIDMSKTIEEVYQ